MPRPGRSWRSKCSCSLRLSVRTPPFHGGESGSIPLGSASRFLSSCFSFSSRQFPKIEAACWGRFVPVLFEFSDRVLGQPSLLCALGVDAQARHRSMPENGHHLLVGATGFRHADSREMAKTVRLAIEWQA